MITANEYCTQIVEILSAHGVRTAYCSPGSRNVPLLISLEANPDIDTKTVVDERSCAFQALGCALVSRQPVALVCTSGTAVLNFAPAVAEAYYAGVPLIVLSADRPLEWIDQDDSQTIRQNGVLDHIVKGSYDIRAIKEGVPPRYTAEMKWSVNRIANEAMIKALDRKMGPVHINVQLSNPLGELSDIVSNKERIVRAVNGYESLDRDLMQEIAQSLSTSRVLLVAGFATPDNKLNKAVKEFASLPNVAVMAETISNIHVSENASMIDSVLSVMSDDQREAMHPDIVISMGGALVSRMLKKFIRDYPPSRHISLGFTNYFGDCFKSMTDKIETDPAKFLRHMSAIVRKITRLSNEDADCMSYAEDWNSLRQYAALTAESYILTSPWSDLKALDYVFRNIGNVNLFVSNGTAVRYSQLIPHSVHAEYCNRGVSGIDGSTATAVGGACSYTNDTTLVSGDMSWLYDSGASTLGSIPARMRIIVIDNEGGGIFRFIPATSSLPEAFLESYLCVPANPDIKKIAEAYGMDSKVCDDIKSLRVGCKWLNMPSESPKMLIIHTPADVSAGVLKGYFNRNHNI